MQSVISMGRLYAVVTRISLERLQKVSAAMPWISLQARMQRPQRMHLDGSLTIEGFVLMRGFVLTTLGRFDSSTLNLLQSS
jgi:hypothetical protein